MKTIFYPLILTLYLFIISCETKEQIDKDNLIQIEKDNLIQIDKNNLIQRDGLWYEKFKDEPYTGNFYNWYPNGQLFEKGY